MGISKSTKFSTEVFERAVRMVREHRDKYPSLWAAMESIAPKIGYVHQTLLSWIGTGSIPVFATA
jgi:transposase